MKNKPVRVIVAVDGGVIEIVDLPPGVELEIREYDVGDAEGNRLRLDDAGNPYLFFLHEHGPDPETV